MTDDSDRVPGPDDPARSRPGDGDPFDIPLHERIVHDIDLDPFLGRSPSVDSSPIASADPLLDRAPFSERPLEALAEMVADERFVDLFARALRTTAPELREYLPRDPRPVLQQFVRAMRFALRSTERAAGDPEQLREVISFAEHLGADHRKLVLTPALYRSFGQALSASLAHLAGPAWNDELDRTLDGVYGVLTAAMLKGADGGIGPARVGATVHSVERPTPQLAVVRLITDEMVHYLPGQHLSVLTPYAPAVWRRLSPANPTNPMGQIEFHVKDVPGGLFSGALVRGATPGDRWVLARPLGHLEVDRAEPMRDVLMVAGGTGIAPLRSLVIDMMRFADNPRVHLFYGARYPGELHDLRTLVDLAGGAPWLTIQPVSEHDEDPWWMGETAPLPSTLHRRRTGRLVDVVTEYGSWADRQVLVAGSPEMIRATVRGMEAVGTPRDSISFDRLW